MRDKKTSYKCKVQVNIQDSRYGLRVNVQYVNLDKLYYIWERKARKDSLQFSVVGF